jgi:hypothetical protein
MDYHGLDPENGKHIKHGVIFITLKNPYLAGSMSILVRVNLLQKTTKFQPDFCCTSSLLISHPLVNHP